MGDANLDCISLLWKTMYWSQFSVVTGSAIFARKHRRSPSHFNLKYGRENSPPDSPSKEYNGPPMSVGADVVENREGLEVSLIYFLVSVDLHFNVLAFYK